MREAYQYRVECSNLILKDKDYESLMETAHYILTHGFYGTYEGKEWVHIPVEEMEVKVIREEETPQRGVCEGSK